MTRRRSKAGERPAGFYRTFTPEKVSSLEEAIMLATEKATAMGIDDLEVNEQQTGVGADGNFHVALRGRTKEA